MSTPSIPKGPDHLFCPYWKKKMSAVCHTCPKWIYVKGTNKNTGEPVDQYNCSDAFVPLLQIETSAHVRGVQDASVEMRDELVKHNDLAAELLDRIVQELPRAVAAALDAHHPTRTINGEPARALDHHR